MPHTPASDAGVEIWFTTDGDPSADPLMLVMGLGTQHLGWDDDLVALFVERGFFVIRHDNRDIGLSTKPVKEPIPVMERLLAAFAGGVVEAPYLLSDMADDAVAVLDHLGLVAAHVVGASMGGMIAQTMAIEHPERVRSLTSIMSTTGAPDVGQPDPTVMPVLLGPPPTSRDEAIERSLMVSAAIGSPGLVDEASVRDRAGRAWDRSTHTVGTGHQLLAIMASPDRTEALGRLDVPTLVVHGEVDPLVTPSGGDATVAAIPGAQRRTIPGMAHDVPRQHWEAIVDDICALAARAASPAARG